MEPEALADVLRWWREKRKAARGRRRPRLRLVLVAYQGEIGVRIVEVKARTYRKG